MVDEANQLATQVLPLLLRVYYNTCTCVLTYVHAFLHIYTYKEAYNEVKPVWAEEVRGLLNFLKCMIFNFKKIVSPW